jgi:Ca2+-binding RTX toxin-like protein
MKTRPVSGDVDIWSAGLGTDTLVVDASAETQSVSLGIGGAPTYFVRSTSSNFYVDAYDVEKVKFKGGSGDDSINTGTGGITVDGGAGIDTWAANLGALTTNVNFTLGTTRAIAAAGLTSILNVERLVLTTGSGDDTVTGGAQADSIYTGDGNDTVNMKTRPVSGDIDIWDGGTGRDTLIVDASAETTGVSLGVGASPAFFVRSASSNFYIDAYNVEKVKFTGGGGDDYISSGAGGVVIAGGGGIDWWLADLSEQTADIVFQLGTTSSIGSAGLTSITGIERLTLTTGKGDDVITGGAQADAIYTGKGDDTIDVKTRPVSGDVDIVDGGAGTDTLVVDASAETLAVSLGSGAAPSFFVRSASGNFYSDDYNIEKVDFTGGAGGDTINSADRALRIDGGDGIDWWQADYSAATKAILFKLGVTNAISAVKLQAIDGIERISLITGSGNDTIRGGSQADYISTKGGNDIIDAGARVSGSDIDVVDGGDGTDTLIVDVSGETLNTSVGTSASPTFFVRSDSGNYFVDAYNMEILRFNGGSGADTASGGADRDTLSGAVGDDVLSGGGAADVLNGDNGNDTLNGGDGKDVLDGGKQNDILRGGGDADTLTGGVGLDVFDYDARLDSTVASADTIQDFTRGQDHIDFRDMDANSHTDGFQHFTFIGSGAFTGVGGELRVAAGIVEADVNADGAADFRIVLANGALLDVTDFFLA